MYIVDCKSNCITNYIERINTILEYLLNVSSYNVKVNYNTACKK